MQPAWQTRIPEKQASLQFEKCNVQFKSKEVSLGKSGSDLSPLFLCKEDQKLEMYLP